MVFRTIYFSVRGNFLFLITLVKCFPFRGAGAGIIPDSRFQIPNSRLKMKRGGLISDCSGKAPSLRGAGWRIPDLKSFQIPDSTLTVVRTYPIQQKKFTGDLLPIGESGKFPFLASMIAKRFYFYGYFFQTPSGLDGAVHR